MTVAEFTDQEWEQGWHHVLRSDPVAGYLYDLQVRYDDDMEGLPEHLRVLRNDPVSVRGRVLSGYEIGHHLRSGGTPPRRSPAWRRCGARGSTYASTHPSTGPSVWWRDHADPHMRALLSAEGPFAKEVDAHASVRDSLPYEAPPDGLFPDVREGNG